MACDMPAVISVSKTLDLANEQAMPQSHDSDLPACLPARCSSTYHSWLQITLQVACDSCTFMSRH